MALFTILPAASRRPPGRISHMTMCKFEACRNCWPFPGRIVGLGRVGLISALGRRCRPQPPFARDGTPIAASRARTRSGAIAPTRLCSPARMADSSRAIHLSVAFQGLPQSSEVFQGVPGLPMFCKVFQGLQGLPSPYIGMGGWRSNGVRLG